ncbi:MAG: hypothetical protein ABL928_11015 [Sphingorhabdus sp.]
MVLTLMIAALFASAPSATVSGAFAAAESEEKQICKYRQKTGTRFKFKDCRTAKEWEEMAENNRAGLKEMTDRPQIEIRRD